jgi:hypothetical protein
MQSVGSIGINVPASSQLPLRRSLPACKAHRTLIHGGALMLDGPRLPSLPCVLTKPQEEEPHGPSVTTLPR